MRILLRTAFWTVVLLTWEAAAWRTDPIFLVGPRAVAASLYRLAFVTGELWPPLGRTLSELALSLALSAVTGIAGGCLLGLSSTARLLLGPLVNALYAVPRVVFFPLIILWFGIGYNAKVVAGVSLGVFPIVLATAAGIQTSGRRYAEVVRAFGGTRLQELVWARIPGAMPSVATGCRLGFGLCLIGITIAEMFISIEGLGGLLIVYSHDFRTDDMLAVAVVIGSLGLAVVTLVARLPLVLVSSAEQVAFAENGEEDRPVGPVG